jgi:transposase-like protein
LALTDDQAAEIAADFQLGATRVELAARYGVHPNTITRALRRSGAPSRPGPHRTLDATQERRVVEAYASGEPTQSIAATFGISAQHVSRIAIAHGMTPRRPHLPGRRRLLMRDEVRASLAGAYLLGDSMRTLARDRGVAYSTVRRALAEAGVAPRRSRVDRRGV